jgi:hypothetical protein
MTSGTKISHSWLKCQTGCYFEIPDGVSEADWTKPEQGGSRYRRRRLIQRRRRETKGAKGEQPHAVKSPGL